MPQYSTRTTSTGKEDYVGSIVEEDGRLTLRRENGFTVSFGGFLATPEGRRVVGESLPDDPPASIVGPDAASPGTASAERGEPTRPLTRAQKRANKKARKEQRKQERREQQEQKALPSADDEETDKASKSLAKNDESEISLSSFGDVALLLQTNESSQQDHDLAEAAAKPLPGDDEDEETR